MREVGLRDGLQIHATFMPTDSRIAWIETEAAAGVGEIEVTTYLRPTQQMFPLPRRPGQRV